MMWVRFPNGQCIQYNTAHYVERSPTGGYTDMYEGKGGKWIAQIPNACVIESMRACAVSNPLTETPADVLKELRAIKRKLGRKPNG